MATIKGKLKTKTASGADVLYPETSADMVVGLGAQLAAKQDALTFNPTIPSGTTTTPLTAIKNGSNYYSLGGGDIPYTNTAPTGPNTSGGIKVVVLSEEPATRYNGYLYIITEPAVTLISFTINAIGTGYNQVNETFQAEEGMTWAEWCDSEYNTDGEFSVSYGRVWNGAFYIKNVSSTDVIIDGQSYSIDSGGGSD